jgi:osmotically-inducible protein OsmY
MQPSRTFVAALAIPTALGLGACHRTPEPSPSPAAHGPAATPQGSASSASAPGSTDADLRQAVSSELREDKHLASAGIQVSATKGVVELTGKVDNLLSKERAARIASAVRWVRAVTNRLDVAPAARPDSDIEHDAEEALTSDAATASLPVHVQVKAGVVTLTGVVDSRQVAELSARTVEGVRGARSVQNSLSTKSSTKRDASAIASDVKERLAWDALVDPDPVQATVKDGRVVLSGTVGSAAESTRVVSDSWVNGVVSVDATQVRVTWPERPAKGSHTAPKLDAEIAKAIKAAAVYEPRVAAFSISTGVADGVVTLTGSVTTLEAKRAMEALTSDIVGVNRIKDDIVVHPSRPVADAKLEATVTDALACDPLTDGKSIHLTIKDGRVTLTGTVGTYFESAEALDVASRIAGVTAVDDALAVRDQSAPYVYFAWEDPYTPYVDNGYVSGTRSAQSDTTIEQRIHSEFNYSPFIMPLDVQVSVKDGKATLTGTVSSYRERQAAVDDARQSGALVVVDQLKLG